MAQAIPITPLTKNELDSWETGQPEELKKWIKATGFRANEGSLCFVPNTLGELDRVLLGMGKQNDSWLFGLLPGKLPTGTYCIASPEWDSSVRDAAALAWALGAYRFERYRNSRGFCPRLVVSADMDIESVRMQADATFLVRDLINTPAADMMPQDLAKAAKDLAQNYDADVKLTVADDLLEENYPLVHAVGRASCHAPQLIDLTWGAPEAPKLTLVGKGVCFDSGGLGIKPVAGMRLMKKDMGGAAHAIGLASMIMSAGLPVRLRVLIPAVENAISDNAFRPGDVIRSRKGLTVEIDNTDAEGRLVLCDALTEAASEAPELIVDFATLTGAARIALGTEMPGYFTNKARVSESLLDAAARMDDPIWPLPLHRPYRQMLDSRIADIANSSSGSFGGAITAALFLQEFLPDEIEWVHFDVMAWNVRNRPARPIGGEAMGMRAMFAYLQDRFTGRR
ncbi:MAG: leucyl aminopeptidase family protein [Gammaproteobacteria bacterium]|nr:leucyl aminopeptidase family protein [Gammaproteobacteria bacterium]